MCRAQGDGVTNLHDARVLVIGGLGFIGVNLTTRLAGLGARVTVLTPDRAKHAGDIPSFERHGVEIVEGDVRDGALISRRVVGCQLVINLSGQSGAVRSMDDPWTDLDVNVRGTLVLLESLRAQNRDARVIIAGSRLQYGHVNQLPVREDAPQNALSVHALHKQAVEKYFELYNRLFGIRYTVARITNPYGPGQPAGRTAYGVINRMIHLAIADRPLTINGDGTQLRDYIPVDDVVTSLVAMASSSAADGRAYNVASGTGTRMSDLAEQVIAIAGAGRIEHVEWPALAQQIETGDFVADIRRIEGELGWRPTIGLRQGLEQTVAFYKRTGNA
jgi:nucleoside-diphosphate-sugar epimerase